MAWFRRLKALSTKFNDDQQRSLRPFDTDLCGFVIGEGAAILVLEEMEHAKARGANLLCELMRYAANGDGYHVFCYTGRPQQCKYDLHHLLVVVVEI